MLHLQGWETGHLGSSALEKNLDPRPMGDPGDLKEEVPQPRAFSPSPTPCLSVLK